MLRKLFRSILRFFRPYPSPPPVPQRQPAFGHGVDPFTGKLSRTIDLAPWYPNIRKRLAFRNKIVVSLGSLTAFIPNLYRLEREYHLRGSDVGVLAGASFSHIDVEDHRRLADEQQRWSVLSQGSDKTTHDVYIPQPPLLVARELDSLTGDQGMGGRPIRCAAAMSTDTTMLRNILRLRDRVVESFREYRLSTAAIMSIESAGGGSAPANRLLVQALMRSLFTTNQYRFLWLPCHEEDIQVDNARGVVANLLAAETSPRVMNFFVLNQHIGRHDTDLALASGILTLAASLPGTGSDSTNTFESLRQKGDLAVMVPRTIAVRLNPVGARHRRHPEDDYQLRVLPNTEVGGLQANLVMEEVARLVQEDPGSYHLVTVAGPFSDQDVLDLQASGRSWLAPGQVKLLVNPMIAPSSDKDGYCFVCDIRVNRRVLPELADFMTREGFTPHGGVDRRELLEELGHLPEREEAGRVDEMVARLLQTRTS